jgi:hypothetical protein
VSSAPKRPNAQGYRDENSVKRKRERSPGLLPLSFRAQESADFKILVVRVRLGGEDRLEAPLFILIVQHYDRNNAQ